MYKQPNRLLQAMWMVLAAVVIVPLIWLGSWVGASWLNESPLGLTWAAVVAWEVWLLLALIAQGALWWSFRSEWAAAWRMVFPFTATVCVMISLPVLKLSLLPFMMLVGILVTASASGAIIAFWEISRKSQSEARDLWEGGLVRLGMVFIAISLVALIIPIPCLGSLGNLQNGGLMAVLDWFLTVIAFTIGYLCMTQKSRASRKRLLSGYL